METVQPLVIGVAGGTGSGKTTVANMIVERVGREKIASVQHDAYYRDQSDKPLEERARVNYDHPDSLETELLISHLIRLRAGQPIEMPVYDFASYTRTGQTRRIAPRPVILVEGILIFVDAALRKQFDVKIFVDTDADLRLIRRLQRDMTERKRSFDSVIQQYIETVRPMHLDFVEPSKRYADVIIPQGGFNQVALDMIVSRVQALLES
ncbi:MAG: uridine kinase [Rudaea sp.]